MRPILAITFLGGIIDELPKTVIGSLPFLGSFLSKTISTMRCISLSPIQKAGKKSIPYLVCKHFPMLKSFIASVSRIRETGLKAICEPLGTQLTHRSSTRSGIPAVIRFRDQKYSSSACACGRSFQALDHL